MYVPVAQVPDGVTTLNVRLLPLTWVVRTQIEPHALAESIQKELQAVSGGLPAGRVRSMAEVHRQSSARARFLMWVVTMFGACALVLAIVGVYSVAAYSVQLRTREFAIRICLGATSRSVRSTVLLQGLGLVGIAVVVGNIGAFLMTRFLSAFLYGITATDVPTFAHASLLLSLAVIGAMIVAARRATLVKPTLALRFE
jgi:putative ABC transport system permease protein